MSRTQQRRFRKSATKKQKTMHDKKKSESKVSRLPSTKEELAIREIRLETISRMKQEINQVIIRNISAEYSGTSDILVTPNSRETAAPKNSDFEDGLELSDYSLLWNMYRPISDESVPADQSILSSQLQTGGKTLQNQSSKNYQEQIDVLQGGTIKQKNTSADDMILVTSDEGNIEDRPLSSSDMSIVSTQPIPVGNVTNFELSLFPPNIPSEFSYRCAVADDTQLPSSKLSESFMRIAKVFAGHFAMCSNAIFGGLRQRVKSLPNESQTASLLLRLSRTSNMLRKTLFRKGRFLGKGAFGNVFLTRTRLGPKQYALKQVDVVFPDTPSEQETKQFLSRQVNALRERDTMLLTNHRFVCNIKASWCEKYRQDKISYFFLMEYAPYGSLSYFILRKLHKTMTYRLYNMPFRTVKSLIMEHQLDAKKINEPQGHDFRKWLFYIYSGEVASGVAYLHKIGLVHRDLKPGNILIGRDYHLRITDFGFSNPRAAYHCYQFYEYSDNTSLLRPEPYAPIDEGDRKAGTVSYDATPEIVRGEIPDTTKYYSMDVWAVGLIIYELFTGTNPFIALTFPPSRRNILRSVMTWYDNILLNEPLFSIIIPDHGCRALLRSVLCDRAFRFTSEELLAALEMRIKTMTGKTLDEISAMPLSGLSSILGTEVQEPDSEFACPWSPSSPTSAALHHPAARIFPHLSLSPSL